MIQIDELIAKHCSDVVQHVAVSNLRTEFDTIVADMEGAK